MLAAMLAVATRPALVVYEVVGLTLPRRCWFNFDQAWAGALIGALAATSATAA